MDPGKEGFERRRKCNYWCFCWCHYWRSNNTPRCHEDKIDDSVVHALLPSPTGAPQGQANQYRGFIDCAQTILREEGTGAFLKGIEPRVLWVGIGGSIFFGVLEKTKSVLAQRSSRRDAKLKL
ncbi:probable S-adenosylmethionine carrier 2, chloroplastic isoform X4 [Panicum virgatum]|uniref:probable S-adenosylmethionine carrier 2, chloroplastic isoform X4 n=1 Tax=Panicum virgatum TaxID=38727 RepID=UPI0019D5AC79|nr:probable S-adenosylmethionine carrier 2, chloroplastic isoform X4 [Panicum virgatum]